MALEHIAQVAVAIDTNCNLLVALRATNLLLTPTPSCVITCCFTARPISISLAGLMIIIIIIIIEKRIKANSLYIQNLI